MSFAGGGSSSPEMRWFAADGERLTGVDMSEPMIVRYAVINRMVTTDDDRRPFRCVTSFGEVQQHCQVSIQVPGKSHALANGT